MHPANKICMRGRQTSCSQIDWGGNGSYLISLFLQHYISSKIVKRHIPLIPPILVALSRIIPKENSGLIRTTASRSNGCSCGRAAVRLPSIPSTNWHMASTHPWNKNGGLPRARKRPAAMSSHALRFLLLAIAYQHLLQTSLVHGAVIPQPLSNVTTNATLGGNPAYCSNNEGWVGNGIIRSDCAEAISEFYRTNVEPRKGQEFEFLTRGVRSISHLPTLITPRKGDYGE